MTGSRRAIVTLMGPTAAGKTGIAMALADRLPVDLISVDSAMVYRGMDIGTAKPNPAELSRYPHALVNIRDPAQRYSAAEFLVDAQVAIESSLARGRLPLLVGGTMLYFKAFRDGLADIPPIAPAIRAEVAARAEVEGLTAMHRYLVDIDPVAAQRIHPHNRQRLLRAIEVHMASGRPISYWWQRQPAGGVAEALDCDLVEIAITQEPAVLRTRIEQRFQAMLGAGLLDEVQALMARGDLGIHLSSIRCVGYRQVWEHLEGATDAATMKQDALRATRALAKRQLTWLRSFPNPRTIDATTPTAVSEILQYLDALAILARLS
jgi:tRNA dimethylallyltransferase